MRKALIFAAVLFVLASIAYAQSPWGQWIRSPEDMRGLRADVDALKAENDALRAALLPLLYDKRLKLAANLAGATARALDENGQQTGWGVWKYDPSSPQGETFVLGTVHMVAINDLIVYNDIHIAALESLAP